MEYSSIFQVQCKKKAHPWTVLSKYVVVFSHLFKTRLYPPIHVFKIANIIVYVCVDIRLLLNSTRNGCNFISWHISLQQYKLDEALFLCSTSEWANRHHDLCSMKIVNAIHSYKYIIKYWYWNHNLNIRRNKWNNLIYLPI